MNETLTEYGLILDGQHQGLAVYPTLNEAMAKAEVLLCLGLLGVRIIELPEAANRIN